LVSYFTLTLKKIALGQNSCFQQCFSSFHLSTKWYSVNEKKILEP
jgi:hypothetical protein